MNVKLDERFKKVAAIIGAAGAKYSSIAHAKKIAYVNSGYSSVNMLCDFQCNRIIGFWKHRQPKRTICGFGLQRSFGRNILGLLTYYLMPNKCKKS